jgi:hypothetical protein
MKEIEELTESYGWTLRELLDYLEDPSMSDQFELTTSAMQCAADLIEFLLVHRA